MLFHLFSVSVFLLRSEIVDLGLSVNCCSLSRRYTCQTYLGGYSAGVPPLPIPNREVKPDHADGTAHKVGE